MIQSLRLIIVVPRRSFAQSLPDFENVRCDHPPVPVQHAILCEDAGGLFARGLGVDDADENARVLRNRLTQGIQILVRGLDGFQRGDERLYDGIAQRFQEIRGLV